MASKELSEMQKAFLHHLANDGRGDIRASMRLAGYSDNTSFHDIAINLIEEIKLVAEKMLAGNAIKAVLKLGDTLDTPGANGAAVAVNAAKEILDRIGMVKQVEPSQTIVADTVYILPPKEPIVQHVESES